MLQLLPEIVVTILLVGKLPEIIVAVLNLNAILPETVAVLLARNEPPRGKTNIVVFEEVRHKSACTSKEKS